MAGSEPDSIHDEEPEHHVLRDRRLRLLAITMSAGIAVAIGMKGVQIVREKGRLSQLEGENALETILTQLEEGGYEYALGEGKERAESMLSLAITRDGDIQIPALYSALINAQDMAIGLSGRNERRDLIQYLTAARLKHLSIVDMLTLLGQAQEIAQDTLHHTLVGMREHIIDSGYVVRQYGDPHEPEGAVFRCFRNDRMCRAAKGECLYVKLDPFNPEVTEQSAADRITGGEVLCATGFRGEVGIQRFNPSTALMFALSDAVVYLQDMSGAICIDPHDGTDTGDDIEAMFSFFGDEILTEGGGGTYVLHDFDRQIHGGRDYPMILNIV